MRVYRTGMVRKALGLLGVAAAAAVALVVSDVAYTVARSVCTGLAAANTTNYGYVLEFVRHGRSWNFREGVGRPARVAA